MFLETYKKGNLSAGETAAFDYLFNDLLKDNFRGNDKKRELSGMNMEDAAPAEFIPSMFYTFLYTANLKEISNGHEFIDCVPLMLCFKAEKTVSGFNFNMIPNDLRAAILDLLVETDDGAYTDNSGNFRVNKNIAKLFLSENGYTAFIDYVRVKTGMDISKSYRTYNRTFIRNARMIEYDMWKYIPYLSFKDAIRGGNLAALQAGMITANNSIR